MLVERRYPLSKELLQRMLDLGLEVEEESTAALHLVENATAEMMCGLDQLMERKEGEGMYLLWVPLIGDVRTLIMDEAHASRSWWKIYFAALVDIVEGIENTAKTCVQLIILKRMDKVFDVLYGRKCKSHVLWAKIGEIRIEVGDKVMLEVSSWKDVVHFGKKEMFASRYVGPFYLANTNLHVHFEEIKVDKTLRFVKEPVDIIDREIRYQESGIWDIVPLHDYVTNFVIWIGGHVPSQCYACSDSLLLTPLCCDDIHEVTPRVSTLAGSSKGTKSQSKSSGKSVQAEEPMFEVPDIEMSQDQGGDLGNKEDQPIVKTGPKHDCRLAQTENPPLTFDELMSTPIDFSAYVMKNLKIDNLPQEILVGPDFNLLKGTYKSLVELEYNFEECYKVVTDRLDWNNPEGHEYPFDLSKPLSLIEAQGRQVVPVNYFFNNDLEYLKGGSSSRKYTTSTKKTKTAKYDNIEGIEDMVLTL
ncbi:hypothetical protein Tco_0327061 [Tanacetum coccineum]